MSLLDWFGGSKNASKGEAPKSPKAEPARPLPRSGSHAERIDRCDGARRQRRQAETELALARAKNPKPGYFKVITSRGEKVIFNLWVSPHEGHVDRRGNQVKRIFPRSLYRGGERVASIPFTHDKQGPYLPASMLFGLPVDPDRFPDEHREILEMFMEPLSRGIREYNEGYKARRRSGRPD